MLPTKREAAAELLRRREARRKISAYISYLNPKYKTSHFSETVCAALDKFVEDVHAGLRPVLILQAPPQHGKSDIVSRNLPPYLMGRFPDLRIAGASYSDELAGTMAQDVRRKLASAEHKRLFPQTAEKRRYDVNRTSEFTSPGGSGSYLGVGVGSGLTGRPVDCLVAGTLITTDCGQVPIEELKAYGASCKVLAYQNGQLRYENIKAFASGKGFGLYRITSERGRVLEVTANHRLYTSRGYVAASELAPGDVLLSAVRKRKNAKSLGIQKIKSKILLSWLCKYWGEDGFFLRGLRAGFVSSKVREILRNMLKEKAARKKRSHSHISPQKRNMPNVPKHVCISEQKWRKVFGILRKTLLGSCARLPHVWKKQSKMEKRSHPVAVSASFRKSLSDNSSRNNFARQQYLRDVQQNHDAHGGSSYRRESGEQCVVEFSDAVRKVSQRSPSADGWEIEADIVATIDRSSEEAAVYDIQVEATSNFFANGILVHNCGIIDDPTKNQQEALSPTTKESHWNWYQTVFTTRLSECSGQIIMATSWAEDDLPGRIIKHFSGDPRLTVLRFPAINRPGETGYNPELPEGALVPGLHSLEKLEETKALLSAYWWSAIYQQSPKPMGGNVFKEDGVRYYLPKDLPEKFDKIIASWDCTFKDTDGTDFVVGQVWGKYGANSYLLAQVRERMSFTKTVKAVVNLREEWPKIREVLIEDKANGPAVIDTLKATVPGIIPIEPDGSKLARAHAVTSYWEAGNVWLPHPDVAPWIKDFVSELTAFPAAANDDQVDALTQALRRLYPLFNRLKITQEALSRAKARTLR